jgi:outer membrane autotransporter protein
MTLTPHALAHWTYYSADDYTETGAGAANLNVDNDSLNIFELGVGVDAAWDMKNRNGSRVKPVLSAGVRYDLVGDEVETTSTFTGGGAAFGTQGMEPGRTTLNLGAGVGYFTTDNWELSAEYDYEYKSDYDGHSGQFRAAYHF